MSDEEYDYDYGSDGGDGGYDYGSDAGGGEAEDELIEIENSFYEGEDLVKENPEGAGITCFPSNPFLLMYHHCFNVTHQSSSSIKSLS